MVASKNVRFSGLSKFLLCLFVGLLVIGLVLVLGFKPEWLAWIVPFFEGYSAEMLVMTAGVAVVFLIPKAGVRFLNWTKSVFKVEDLEAHKLIIIILTGGSALLLAVTSAFADGISFTFGNLIFFTTEAYLLSQVAYKHLFKE